MKISPSEQYIQNLFKSRYGINLNKINEHGGNNGLTPDFECISYGQRIFVCELKEFIDVPLSKKSGRTIINHPDGSIESYGNDNAINRISKDIYKAHKQLSKYTEPKILIFLSNTSLLNVRDLDETFNGFSILAVEGNTRYVNIYAKRASEGKIKDIKKKIDLYIWVESADDKIYFRTVTEIGLKIVKEHFDNPIDVSTD
jgi:hypothetical protein